MKKTLIGGFLLALALLPSLAAAQTRIVIDPGHGGTDPGGVGNGLQEKNIVLDVGTRFRNLLNADSADTRGGGNWTALMTRSTDVFVSLSGRAAYSNNQGAARFMSIHSNAFSNTTANGTETFSFAEGTTGAALRNLVQAEMIAAWGTTNRGNKTANFAVLRDTAAPAILHELAFITNAADAAKLGNATRRQQAAVAHLRGIQRHYGISPYLPASTVAGPEELPAEELPATPGDELVDEELGADEEGAGCSTSAGSSGTLTVLALIGLVAFTRRRRI